MRDRQPVGSGHDVGIEHHEALAKLQNPAVRIDGACLGLAREIDVQVGRY